LKRLVAGGGARGDRRERRAGRVLEDPNEVAAITRDPHDNYVVALGRKAGAEAIVTGDRYLLDRPGLEPPAIDARAACELLSLL
jgi:uncharacterized protein